MRKKEISKHSDTEPMRKKEIAKHSDTEPKNQSSRPTSRKITPIMSRRNSEKKIPSIGKRLTPGPPNLNTIHKEAFEGRSKQDNRKLLENSIIKTVSENSNVQTIVDISELDKNDQQVFLTLKLQNKECEQLKAFLDGIDTLYDDFPKDYLAVRKRIISTYKNKTSNKKKYDELCEKKLQLEKKLDEITTQKIIFFKNNRDSQKTEYVSFNKDKNRKLGYLKLQKKNFEHEYEHNKNVINTKQETYIKLKETNGMPEINEKFNKVTEQLQEYLASQQVQKSDTEERVLQQKKLNTNELIANQDNTNEKIKFQINDLKSCINNEPNPSKKITIAANKENSSKKRLRKSAGKDVFKDFNNKENNIYII